MENSNEINEPPPSLLRISPDDNVFIALRNFALGTILDTDDGSIVLDAAVGLGHKIAARKIATGEKICKYGAPIGSATTDIAAGSHVHLHNMKSDYLPTYLRGNHDN